METGEGVMATGGVVGYVTLTGFVEKEDNQFVSYCRELGTSSCGDTVEDAFQNLDDAIEVHIAVLVETGELLRVLRERHIRIDVQPVSDEELSIRVPPGKISMTYQREVPAAEPQPA